MPHAVILCGGSRGDVEPFCALASAMVASESWTVTLGVPQDYAQLVPSHLAISTLEFPFGTTDMYKFFPPASPTDGPVPIATALGGVIADLVLPCAAQARDSRPVEADTRIVLASYLARPLALLLARAWGARTAVVQLQPQAPTGDFPHHFLGSSEAVCGFADYEASRLTPADRDAFMESYLAVERSMYALFEDALQSAAKEIGVSAPSLDDILELSCGTQEAAVFNAYPEELVPRRSDAGNEVEDVGSLAATYIPDKWDLSQVPQALQDFLAQSPRPAMIGFGSLGGSYGDGSLQMLLRSLHEAGIPRAILVESNGKAVGLTAEISSDESSEVKFRRMEFRLPPGGLPYAWLLPQVDIVVCHGGAGVLGAAIAAGRPLLIAPILADQPFWGPIIEMRGLGANIGCALPAASEDKLLRAVRLALSSDTRRKCEEVMKDMRSSGADAAVKALNMYL